MKRSSWRLIVLSVVFVFVAAGGTSCGDTTSQEFDASPSISDIPADQSRLTIILHDFPLNDQEISEVLIDLQQVQILNEAGEMFVVNDTPAEFDLLTLVDDVTLVIVKAKS